MVSTCRDLGYEYMAITDHSPASGLSQSLTVQNVRRQADEVEQLRERFPDITILHGCEVDILPEGRLDFPDRVLERFDIVLASLHHRGSDGRDQLLRRYQAAMRHPLVTVITHPTNRLVSLTCPVASRNTPPPWWPYPTGCARCRIRSLGSSPIGGRLWALTASACPTPARRCAATSVSMRLQ